jgi:salicylate hydroxylase
MALLDAYALAEAMRRADDVAGALTLYPRLRTLHVRLYQAMSLVFTPAYQSDGRVLPWLRDLIVGPIARLWPADLIQAAMVSGVLGAPLRPLGLDAVTRAPLV